MNNELKNKKQIDKKKDDKKTLITKCHFVEALLDNFNKLVFHLKDCDP
jgi:hypothetical protein